MNNSQEIILAQISAIYDKPPFVKVKTGQMEMILKCVGLGKYYDEYAKYLEPYWYNRGFQNDIESYRIFVGLNSIFEDLLNAHKGEEIISLLTELGNHIQGNILCDGGDFVNDFNRLCQLYNLMGLQIVSTEIDEYSSKFEVKPYLNEGNHIIQSFGMEQWLKNKYQDVYASYESALNSFERGDMGAAIESCRTALTGIFSKYKGVPFQNARWMLGMATITGDFTGTQPADASEICASISRFARNFSDCMTQIAALKTMHPAHPIGVYFETENIYTLNPSSQYSLDIQALLADWESGNKSRRMILSYDQRIMTGQYPVADICVLQRKDRKAIAITPCAAEHPMSFKVPGRLLTDGQCRMMINGIQFIKKRTYRV